MLENVISFPFVFSGTTATSGSIVLISPFAMTFRAGYIWVNAVDGGTIQVRSADTAQGTAALVTNACKAGTLYSGTTPFLGNGTSIDSLRIPANGTIVIAGTCNSADMVMVGGVYFSVDD